MTTKFVTDPPSSIRSLTRSRAIQLKSLSPKIMIDGFCLIGLTSAQRADTHLGTIVASLEAESSTPRNRQHFLIWNGALYKRHYPKTSQETLLLVIPEAHGSDVLRGIHDSPEGGHIGQRATLRKAMERYWWPKMFSFIRHYVASCQTCQQFKRLPGPVKRELTPIPPPDIIFHTIGIDHIVFYLVPVPEANTSW